MEISLSETIFISSRNCFHKKHRRGTKVSEEVILVGWTSILKAQENMNFL